MGVQGAQSAAVVEHDGRAVAALGSRDDNRAVSSGVDRPASRTVEVDAVVVAHVTEDRMQAGAEERCDVERVDRRDELAVERGDLAGDELRLDQDLFDVLGRAIACAEFGGELRLAFPDRRHLLGGFVELLAVRLDDVALFLEEVAECQLDLGGHRDAFAFKYGFGVVDGCAEQVRVVHRQHDIGHGFGVAAAHVGLDCLALKEAAFGGELATTPGELGSRLAEFAARFEHVRLCVTHQVAGGAEADLEIGQLFFETQDLGRQSVEAIERLLLFTGGGFKVADAAFELRVSHAFGCAGQEGVAREHCVGRDV